eukprot:s4583_g7.t1
MSAAGFPDPLFGPEESGPPVVVDPGPDCVVAVPAESDGSDAVVCILFCECHVVRVPCDVRVFQCLLDGRYVGELFRLTELAEHVLEPWIVGGGQHGKLACESECCEPKQEHRVILRFEEGSPDVVVQYVMAARPDVRRMDRCDAVVVANAPAHVRHGVARVRRCRLRWCHVRVAHGIRLARVVYLVIASSDRVILGVERMESACWERSMMFMSVSQASGPVIQVLRSSTKMALWQEGALVVLVEVVDQFGDVGRGLEVVEDGKGLWDVDRVECLAEVLAEQDEVVIPCRADVVEQPGVEKGTESPGDASDADGSGAAGGFGDEPDQGLVPGLGQSAGVDDGVPQFRECFPPGLWEGQGCDLRWPVCWDARRSSAVLLRRVQAAVVLPASRAWVPGGVPVVEVAIAVKCDAVGQEGAHHPFVRGAVEVAQDDEVLAGPPEGKGSLLDEGISCLEVRLVCVDVRHVEGSVAVAMQLDVLDPAGVDWWVLVCGCWWLPDGEGCADQHGCEAVIVVWGAQAVDVVITCDGECFMPCVTQVLGVERADRKVVGCRHCDDLPVWWDLVSECLLRVSAACWNMLVRDSRVWLRSFLGARASLRSRWMRALRICLERRLWLGWQGLSRSLCNFVLWLRVRLPHLVQSQMRRMA